MKHALVRSLTVLAVVIGSLVAAPTARAGVVVVRGVELQLPEHWAQKSKGAMTVLGPIKHKGRALEVISLAQLPAATPEALEALLGSEQLDITAVKEGARDGVKVLVATGKVVTPKGTVAVDLMAFPVADKAVLLLSFVGDDQDPLIRQANLDIMASARIPGPRMSIAYTAPKQPGIVGPSKLLVSKIAKVTTNLDSRLRLPRPLPVKFAECGKINAFYSGSAHTITMCHELYDDFVKLFTGAGLDPRKAEAVAGGAFVFTFFHELGHALVGELGLPITGRGEDAADELATLVLAQNGNEGHGAALSGAAWFDTMAKQGHPSVFWDTHSFDQQRLVTILCLLYGADKTKYAAIMRAQQIPQSRLAKCTRDYPLRMKAWRGMLAPHEKRAK